MISQTTRIAAALFMVTTLGACASGPLDFIAPADLALIRSEKLPGESEPISVEALLSQARGEETEPLGDVAGDSKPVSVADMLATARTSAPSNAEQPENQPLPGPAPGPVPASVQPPALPISLDELRRQVLGRTGDTNEANGCT